MWEIWPATLVTSVLPKAFISMADQINVLLVHAVLSSAAVVILYTMMLKYVVLGSSMLTYECGVYAKSTVPCLCVLSLYCS